MTGAKMRVYEIARELGVANKELISKIRALGLEVNNHMSSLEADDAARVKRAVEKDRLANTETKRLSSTVLRRRTKGSAVRAAKSVGPAPSAESEVTVEVATPVRRRRATAAVAKTPAAEQVVQPEPVVTEPEPAVVEPEAQVAPEPTPAPPQAVEAAVEQAGTPEAVVAPEPEEVAPVEDKPTTPAVIEGPRVVRLSTAKAAQQEAEQTPESARAEEAETTASAAQAPEEDNGAAAEAFVAELEQEPAGQAPPAQEQGEVPTTLQDVAESARDRFERELARARNRVAEREEQSKKKLEERPEVEEQRDPTRPAVGTIISLPVPRIKITERAPTRQMPGQGQVRGRFAQQRGRARKTREFGKKKQQLKKIGGKSTQITTPAEHKRVIRMEDTIAIPDLAKAMGVKATEVLKKLWSMGMVGININATIDFETAQIIAGEFHYEVQNVAFKEEEVFVAHEDEETELVERAPVVTVMGHVDHGKTSLLDFIRSTHVTKGEAGGITQHIAAYRVNAGKEFGDVVFLDTPGHEAFTEMRARGAQCTDIVVLVVAANDGVMPQTLEALAHSKDAGVPVIVAINKCDLVDANPERVKQQLAEHALIPEEWGGETLYCEVSALTGDGVDKLLESIALSAELMELRANPDKPAVGVVIEAKLDRNRGPMATVLIKEGTLKLGQAVVAGESFGKVRAMLDDKGKVVKVAGPSTPIELLGLDGVPSAGEILNVADDEKKAKQVVEHRRQAKRKKELATTGRISIENIMEKIQEGEAKELKVVLKADVQGSAEALKASLLKLSTEKVRVNVIQAGVGGINLNDVNLAKAGNAIVVGFHVRAAGKAGKLAEKEGVLVKLYDIIYEAIDDVKAAMAGLLAPVKRRHDVGRLEVRDTFSIPKTGLVAGCIVTDGKITRKNMLRVVRDAVQIYEGRVGSLRRFKEDASEVQKGFECGVIVDGFNDIKVGDVIEAFEIIEEAATL